MRVAGVGSMLSALSVARTAKVCEPTESAVAGLWLVPGPEQSANAWESKRHLKVEFGSLDANWKVGLRLAVELCGPAVMVVCGAVESST